jgi:hypothetical protein
MPIRRSSTSPVAQALPMSHPDTQAIHAYWSAKCAGRPMPSRADIDPLGIPRRLLPFISIVEAVPDARRYVYRLVGTADVQVRGFDPTGKSIHEGHLAPNAEDAIGRYDRVVATAAPLVDAAPYVEDGSRYKTEEAIFLPLSDDGTTVNMILVFAACRDLLSPHALMRSGI